MTAPDSPAVRKARRCARNPLAFPSLSAKHAAELLAELDEARQELAGLAEWSCPSCGATTRARMADHTPPTEGSAP